MERDGKLFLQTRSLKYKDARDQSVEAHRTAFGENCSAACLKAQLDAYHTQKCGIQPDTKIKTVVEGRCKPEDVRKAGGDNLLSSQERAALDRAKTGNKE